MKKIFYILAAAIVALGTVACENEGLDNINPNINVDGDTVSFVAGINRTDLDGTATVWDAEDTIVVTWNETNYEFTNVGQADKNTFSCTADGLSAIVEAESIKAVYSNNKDGNVDSAAGVAGALLEYEGAFGNIAFEVKNAFLKFTTSETVTLTASEGLFGEGTELVISEAGEHYVAINPVAATLEYKVGESMGKNLETTFEAKKIYNLGNLTKSIAGDSNGKYYTELATAFKLAESGATITLFEDIALEGLTEGVLMKVDKNLTLNVGEHTLTATLPTATKNASIFTVTKGAEFTLVGAGNIVIENGGGSSIGNHFISNEGGIVNLDMDGGIELNVVGTPFINCIVDNNSTVGAATLNVKKGTYKQNSGNIFRNFVNHKTELATINISGGSIIGTGEKSLYIWNQKMGKTTGILNITAGTFEKVQIDNDDATLNQVTFTAEGYTLQQNANGYFDIVEKTPVAKDDKGNFYTELADAFKLAENGATISLLGDIVLESGVTVAAGKEYTLDLAGKTISQEKANTTGYVMVNNNGTLTIEDTVGEGKMTFTELGDGDSSYGWGSYTLRNNGTLTINGGTIENATRAISHCATPLMLYAGKTTINGGNIISANYRTIQGFWTPEVVINGGNFEGQVWMQWTCSEGASLTINGGTFAPRGTDGSSVYVNNGVGEEGTTTNNDIKLSITGGTFTTKVGCTDETRGGVVGAITGGIYTEDAYTTGKTQVLIAEGYVAKNNGDGTYTVVAAQAKVGTTLYATWAEAYAAAEAGSTIELLANVGDVTISKACVINAGEYTINITAGEGYKVTNSGTTWTVAEKQAYRVYILDNCGWTKKIHAWTSGTNGDVNITGDWNSTSISKSATVNGFSFAYYEFDKNYDGKTVNYIISNNGDDYWRKEYNNIVLNSDKYYRINAVGEIIEINPNDLSTFKFTLYIYDQSNVNASHALFYANTATGTANAESGRVGYNWKNYDYFILDGSKIGTDFKVSVKTTVNSSTKTITNLSISKNIKTDLCIGYWNNSGDHGYWANSSSPFTTLLNN